MVTQDHYFSPDPKVASHPRTIRVTLPDLSFELDTDRGVFAHGHLDAGTDLLLRTLGPIPPGELVDVGLRVWRDRHHAGAAQPRRPGVGGRREPPGARPLRAQCRTRRRARTWCPPNRTRSPTGLRFAAMYSNPPVRLGKPSLHELLLTWIGRLQPEAAATLVVQRHLGADSLAAWLTGLGHRVERVRSKAGYRDPRGACRRRKPA